MNALVMGKVVSMNESGVHVDDGERLHSVPWTELNRLPGDLQQRAEAYALTHSPLTVSVGHDQTGVWYTVSVTVEWTGHGTRRFFAADDGGTHGQHAWAVKEAREVARRIGRRAQLDV